MKIIILCILWLSFYGISYAYDGNPKNLAFKIDSYIGENFDITKRFPIYSGIRERVTQKIIELPNTETQKRQYLKDLIFYNNNNILKLVEKITSREGVRERYVVWQAQEIQELNDFRNNTTKENQLSSDIIVLSATNEFSANNNIYKIHFNLYEPIDDEQDINSLEDIFFREDIGLFTLDLKKVERKIPITEIIDSGNHRFLSYSDNYFVQNDIIYTYEYEEYYPVNSFYGIYASEIEGFGYEVEDAVFLRLQDGKTNITFKPQKKKIVDISDIELGKDNLDFINQTTIDILRDSKNYSQIVRDIIQLGKDLTQDATSDEEKIQNIYSWMVENIYYPESYNKANYKLYSGLEAYIEKKAICEGQVSLMYYLLKIAGIEDVYPIQGYVVNSPDFPEVGHAWVQIGDYFYDPSFETEVQKDFANYNYYKIPYDIAYTNRYNLRDIPEQLLANTESLKTRIPHEIARRRYELTDKYSEKDGYRLLENSFFRKKIGLGPNDTISLEGLKSYFNVYKVEQKDGNIIVYDDMFEDEIEYYAIDSFEQDIEEVMVQINFDIEDYVLLEIYEDDNLLYYGLSNSLKK